MCSDFGNPSLNYSLVLKEDFPTDFKHQVGFHSTLRNDQYKSISSNDSPLTIWTSRTLNTYLSYLIQNRDMQRTKLRKWVISRATNPIAKSNLINSLVTKKGFATTSSASRTNLATTSLCHLCYYSYQFFYSKTLFRAKRIRATHLRK